MSATPEYTRLRERQGPLPLSTRIYQGVGALPGTYKDFAFNTFLLFFYNQVLGLSPSLASLALMLAILVDAVSDPLVGSYSDRLNARLGRRHPLMYASVLPLGISLLLLFMPPAGLSEFSLFAWLLTFAVAVRTAITFFGVPWAALFAEFTDDYAERTTLLSFRFLVGWIGGTIFVFSTWTFIFPSSEAYTPGHLNPDGYPLFGAIVGLLVALTAFLTTHLTRREIPYLLQPVAQDRYQLKNVFIDFLSALRNRDYLVLFVGLLVSSAITGTLGAFELYINTYFWALLPEDLRWFTIAIGGSLLAFITIPALQKRFDKKHLLIGMMVFLLINGIGMISLRFLDVLPPNGSTLLLGILIGNELIRVYAGTIVVMMFISMVADTLDAQELNTGKRQEGVFSAAISFSAKATTGFGVLIAGLVLEHLIGFPEGAKPSELANEVTVRLGMIAGILIPLFYLIPFYMVSRYDISRAKHAEIQTALKARRADASPASSGAPVASTGDSP